LPEYIKICATQETIKPVNIATNTRARFDAIKLNNLFLTLFMAYHTNFNKKTKL